MGSLIKPEPHIVICHVCRGPIDVWEPAGLTVGPDPATGRHVLTRVDPSEAVCPDCKVRAVPEAARGDVATLYTAMRCVRAEIDAPLLGTVFVLHNRGDGAGRWASAFRATLYALKFPYWCRTFPQPHLTFTPDDATEAPIHFVGFALEIVHHLTPQTWLQFRWSYARPERRARMETFGWDDPSLTPDDLARLADGRRFLLEYTAAVAGGRPRGRFKRDRAWYLDAYRRLTLELRRPPTQEQFCGHYELDPKTLRRNLKAYRLWPWEAFVTTAGRASTRRR